MGMKLKYITPLLAAGAAAVAIAAAPMASQPISSPAQEPSASRPARSHHDPPPHVQYHPYGGADQLGPQMSSSILTGQ